MTQYKIYCIIGGKLYNVLEIYKNKDMNKV